MILFEIAETKNFQKIKSKLEPKLYQKILNNVYPQLKSNPFYGANIKKLKGEFEGYYRYRVGDYRLFYIIENEKILVIVTDFRHRQSSYD
ncbi:MAG: type II toxin-antitoxin system RelE/ParE family toxin [Campylobacterales bacterium]|nr:type II toxin-antitoxin system RelE/ParE family toxin [Campylobacterales bacterium]